MQRLTDPELLAELDAAKASNLACLLHAEAHPRREPTSIWSQPYERRTLFMRQRCGRARTPAGER